MSAEQPVTRAELRAALDETKDDLKGFMRQIETNMLTAFHSYSQGMTAGYTRWMSSTAKCGFAWRLSRTASWRSKLAGLNKREQLEASL